MADNNKLQTVKDVNATMERYGVKSDLLANKAMTVGEFSQLVSQIQFPAMSEEVLEAFNDYLYSNYSKVFIMYNFYESKNVPGYVTVDLGFETKEIDIQESVGCKVLNVSHSSNTFSVSCEQRFKAAWFISQRKVAVFKDESMADFNPNGDSSMLLLFFGD